MRPAFAADLPPLVAILRGLQPERAADVGRVLFDCGLRGVEVPLNRPGALPAIATLAAMAPADALVGAGTVLAEADVDAVAQAGGRLIVSPHFDPAIVARTIARGLIAAPGVFTASEAFAALRAGAHALKLFPAEGSSPAALRALATVLPEDTPLWPVGGLEPEHLAAWRAAGATGFGIGGALFKPAFDLDEIARRARAFVAAWHG
ncbi:2-dehydro-3-deoxy-6-phosphogalactonate aldolase [Aquincola sp. S2]|uniref:2-dehydro-3-deoxy-6-phosphogalactonate aldolase n=1 Tax=Pseudaquabacterium terrae TaxID=2732868 RepID=A0ABX2ER36_9BURK|nr:2-dehydro-3-deoxy-6-phosphogalactonate aldolase [Aquabacterium terrae]NRF71150.1 2-dehydro-3-deoxy-6-phosphogalactonate aldolase [Aquabacterium terrae]